jgi:hypothetical protein
VSDKYVKPTRLVVSGPYKSERREAQRRKRTQGMQESGRSVKTLARIIARKLGKEV